MNDELRSQIHGELDLRETDDLLDIWRANDRSAWSNVAFEEVEKILVRRLGEAPPQGLSPDEIGDRNSAEDEGLEEWEIRVLDAADQPQFYDVIDVIWLRQMIRRVLIAAVVVFVLVGIADFPVYDFSISRGLASTRQLMPLAPLLAGIAVALEAGVRIAVTYAVLKGVLNILRILMDMEFRSRSSPA
jgi:hypothetical protein